MKTTINAKELRASLPKLVERVRKGARFVVIYRSRPAFQMVPVDDLDVPSTRPEDDPLFRARAVGRSRDRRTAAEHDETIYGR